MRLNATGTKRALAKTLTNVKAKVTHFATCGEELAYAFSNSKRFSGQKFFPQGFKLSGDGLRYESSGKLDEFDDYTSEWFFRFERFGDNCGMLIVCELDEIPAEPEIQAAVMRAVACAAREGRFGMLLASVNHKQKQSRAMLEAFGMTPVFETHNPNSTNDITLFCKDITKVKDTLGIGNTDYDNSARSWLSND